MKSTNLAFFGLFGILIGMLSGLILSCAAPLPRVALFAYNLEDPYIASFVSQISDQVGNSFTLETYDARNSQVLQNEDLELAVKEGVDLLLVNPVDRLSAYGIIQHARERYIPLIFFNREPLATDLALWDSTYYVGAQAIQSAVLQAELVASLFGGNPQSLNLFDRNADNRIQAILFKGEQGHQDAEIRTTGFVETMTTMGFDLEVLALEVANWDRAEAYDTSGPLFANFGSQIELVVSNNDNMALGVISRMRQISLFEDTNQNGRVDQDDSGWIPVIGIDGLDEAVIQIEEGYLYGTVVNDSNRMATAIAELSRVLLGQRSWEDFPFPLTNEKYIWIDYLPFSRGLP